MATSPQTLIEEANCHQCYAGLSLADMIKVALLDRISVSAGGGAVSGGGGTAIGAGDPEGSVTADPGTIYFATGSQTLWVKQTGAGNTGWLQLI